MSTRLISVERLVWDDWNVGHIARHRVLPDEVEDMCQGQPLVQEGYKQRLILIGPTVAGRMVAAVLEPLGGDMYYPVTARPASRKERRLYQVELEKG